MAAAFQLVGFPHVIATLWQAGDASAIEVADEFYRQLAAGAALDPDRAAVALHHAVTALRGGSRYRPVISAWAPYIHVGA